MNDKITADGTMIVTALQNRQRVSVKFPSGAEMVEEYSTETGTLEFRKWQWKNKYGRSSGWVVEIGSNEDGTAAADLALARSNPVFIPMDHRAAFEWRIRNLPYPIATYQLTVDDEKQELVLRTTNKKYFKRFAIPALKRHGIPLDKVNIAMHHAHNTLVIRYRKPLTILEYEREHRAKIQANLKGGSGDPECKTQ
mgnify:CR=1 FL=1